MRENRRKPSHFYPQGAQIELVQSGPDSNHGRNRTSGLTPVSLSAALGVFLMAFFSSGCVAVFNNPDSEGTTNASNSGGTSSTSSAASTDSVSFSSFEVNNQAGWLKKFTGTCSSDGTTVSFSEAGGQVSGSTTCSSGTFTVYLDVSLLSVASHSISATHGDATASTTINKISANCDTAGDRDNTYADGMAGGAGTSTDPYIICTPDQLNEVRNGLGDNYTLNNDIYFEYGDSNGDGTIDGSDTDYRSGSGWTRIHNFLRKFDGQNFVVDNLFIDNGGASYQGLFGRVYYSNQAPTPILKNIHVRNADVTGAGNSGILAGFIRGMLVNSSATGTLSCSGDKCGGLVAEANSGYVISSMADVAVISTANHVGGLVGYTENSNTIADCAAKGNVEGVERVGGLVGYPYQGNVLNSYATGDVSGDLYVGGFAGYTVRTYTNSYATGDVTSSGGYAGGFSGYRGTLTNSFATGNVTGDVAASTVGPLTADIASTSYYYSGATCTNNNGGGSCNSNGTAEANLSNLYDPTQLPLSNWDFEGAYDSLPSDHWIVQSGAHPVKWFDSTTTFLYSSSLSGSGTYSDPFEISNATELNSIASNPAYMSKYFELTASFNASGLATYYPIGRDSAFGGGFLGNSNTITGLQVTDGNDFAALIGWMCGHVVNNLNLASVDIDGDSYAAGVVGYLHCGELDSVSVSGTVDATSYSGGIIGRDGEASTSTDLSSSVDVTCSGNYCGGVAATLGGYGGISRVSFTGTVSGTGYIGGIAGSIGRDLTDCYSNSTSIDGTNRVGGIAGRFSGSRPMTNCYSASTVSGDSLVGGLAGEALNSVDFLNSFAVGNVTGDSAGASDVSLFVGDAAGTHTFTNNYALDTATCTNNGAGGTCNTSNYTGTNPISTFYNPGNAPMTGNWDFGSVWQDNSGTNALPTLQ